VNLVSTITGLPYVGKTTIFNLLTGGHAATGAFAGAEGETNVGVAKVPDERVEKLSGLFKPKKTTYAEVTYRDIGLAHAAQQGQGISTQKLGDLRSSDALVHVVRAFRDPSVPHVDTTVDAVRDLASLELELLFADHAVVERRLERIEPELRSAKGPEKEAREREKLVLQKAMAALDTETPLRDIALDDEERKAVRGYRFLTLQPQLVVANIDEADVAKPDAVLAPLRAAPRHHLERLEPARRRRRARGEEERSDSGRERERDGGTRKRAARSRRGHARSSARSTAWATASGVRPSVATRTCAASA